MEFKFASKESSLRFVEFKFSFCEFKFLSKESSFCKRLWAPSYTVKRMIAIIWIFQPGRPGWNSRNKTKRVKQTCIVRDCRSFVDSCNFTSKANSHAFEVQIYTRQKLWHFGRYDAKAKLFCQKSFVPVTGGGVFIRENSHPGYRDLGKRASPASHMNTSNFLRRKEWRSEISETEPARLTGLIWRGQLKFQPRMKFAM